MRPRRKTESVGRTWRALLGAFLRRWRWLGRITARERRVHRHFGDEPGNDVSDQFEPGQAPLLEAAFQKPQAHPKAGSPVSRRQSEQCFPKQAQNAQYLCGKRASTRGFHNRRKRREQEVGPQGRGRPLPWNAIRTALRARSRPPLARDLVKGFVRPLRPGAKGMVLGQFREPPPHRRAAGAWRQAIFEPVLPVRLPGLERRRRPISKPFLGDEAQRFLDYRVGVPFPRRHKNRQKREGVGTSSPATTTKDPQIQGLPIPILSRLDPVPALRAGSGTEFL